METVHIILKRLLKTICLACDFLKVIKKWVIQGGAATLPLQYEDQ